jgi:hypothetical protein
MMRGSERWRASLRQGTPPFTPRRLSGGMAQTVLSGSTRSFYVTAPCNCPVTVLASAARMTALCGPSAAKRTSAMTVVALPCYQISLLPERCVQIVHGQQTIATGCTLHDCLFEQVPDGLAEASGGGGGRRDRTARAHRGLVGVPAAGGWGGGVMRVGQPRPRCAGGVADIVPFNVAIRNRCADPPACRACRR